MIERDQFIEMLECNRESAVSTITACFLLTPGVAQEYEEAIDQDAFYREATHYITEKTNSELLEEAIYLGITE